MNTPRKKRIILFLAANPKNSTSLRLNEEVREIEAGLQRSKYRNKFQLEQRWAVTSIPHSAAPQMKYERNLPKPVFYLEEKD